MTEKASILAVDDEAMVTELIKRQLSSLGYGCDTAGNCAEAREAVNKANYDLVLLDIRMPDGSGVDVLDYILTTAPDTAVVMATAVDDVGQAVECFRKGAYAYILKPIDLDDLAIQVANALRRKQLELENHSYQTQLENMVEERTQDLLDAMRQVDRNLDRTIQALCTAVQLRITEEREHGHRVAKVAVALGRELKLPGEKLKDLERGAYLRDVGMLGIPDRIILKPGPLDEDEWEEVRQHPEIGYEIVSRVDLLKEPAQIVLCHQERYDGKGYPRGLKGEHIPLGARVVALGDTVDGMLRQRPYKVAVGFSAAKEDIKLLAGNQLDPKVVEAFLGVGDQVRSTVYPHVEP